MDPAAVCCWPARFQPVCEPSARGHKFYDLSDTNSPDCKFPAHVETPHTSTDFDSWKPPAAAQGDIARALFYMAIRYTGDGSNGPAALLCQPGTLSFLPNPAVL